MEFRKFNPKDIMVPTDRVTSEMEPDIHEQFENSLESDKEAVFIECSLIDGKPWLIDGWHRLDHALRYNWPEINVALVEGNEIDVMTRNLKLDHLRGRHPVTQMLRVIKLLTDEEHLTVEGIVTKTGLKRPYVENLMLINELTPHCQSALDEGKIKMGHAVELTRIKDPIRQDAVCLNLEMYGWTVKEFHDYVTDVLNIVKSQSAPPTQQQPRPPVKIKCFYCGEEHDVSELANPTTCRECSLTLTIAVKTARAELLAETKAELKTPPAESPPKP